MRATIDTPKTPISSKADRSDERVRLIEEAVLLMRGEWPAAAAGICETVNRATGIFSPAEELEAAIDEAGGEAERLVERLYGREALLEVRGLAAAGSERWAVTTSEADAPRRDHGGRRRLRLPSRSPQPVRARASW